MQCWVYREIIIRLSMHSLINSSIHLWPTELCLWTATVLGVGGPVLNETEQTLSSHCFQGRMTNLITWIICSLNFYVISNILGMLKYIIMDGVLTWLGLVGSSSKEVAFNLGLTENGGLGRREEKEEWNGMARETQLSRWAEELLGPAPPWICRKWLTGFSFLFFF